jgi:DNA-binding MarR family transcriptional regulator
VTTDPLSEARSRVIEDFGRYFSQWGMSAAAGRLWAYLLMESRPASLDEISADLQVSKSTASLAARELERMQFCRRSRVPGSKRVLYQANDISERFLRSVVAAYGSFLDLFDAAAAAAEAPDARERLGGMAQFYHRWVDNLTGFIDGWLREER